LIKNETCYFSNVILQGKTEFFSEASPYFCIFVDIYHNIKQIQHYSSVNISFVAPQKFLFS